MFCMNCGQQLPDGAKFCLNCGTPQGAISPTGTTQAETINLDGMHTFVPAMCPNCNAHMKVDTSSKVARCESCGTECLVQDAIKTLTVSGNVQVGNATINVNGINTYSLLQRAETMLSDGDFSGAISKCDTILDVDPTNGEAYFYLLLANLKCRNRNDLANQPATFDGNQYYIKAIQYGDDSLKSELLGYTNAINLRDEARLKNLKAGDEIYFGTQNGQRIWWRVLKVGNHMAFIISSNNLNSMQFHNKLEPISWTNCTLRQWLNNEFIQYYFTPAEQARILPCNLSNDNNFQYNPPASALTTDKVFLLSWNEANRLLAKNATKENISWWWLRSPSRIPNVAAEVCNIGLGLAERHNVNSNYGVRPALWIKLDD